MALHGLPSPQAKCQTRPGKKRQAQD
ncbi:uncharacterized protein METZ01_LOCUS275017, partial [marine metagenome]